MKKILVFGNGVSMRYTKINEYESKYDYKNLSSRFVDYLYSQNIVTIDAVDNEIKSELENGFNESTIFKIYKILVIESIKYWFQDEDKEEKIQSPIDVWNSFYEPIKKYDSWIIRPKFLYCFNEIYNKLNFCLTAAICKIPNENNWIQINYEPQFIEYLKNYNAIYTTNYYVGNMDDIKHLHGQVNIDNEYFEHHTMFDRSKHWNEAVMGSEIIFGGNYDDKSFLKTIRSGSGGNGTHLKRREPCSGYEEFSNMNINPNDAHALSDIKNSTIDILGLSTLGDKHIIKVIAIKAYKINIYCNSIKSYESWKNEFNDVLDKCTFYCNHSYPGFQKEDNTSCELCKILSNDN